LAPRDSNPNCGTLIQRILKWLTPAKPSACTGKVFRKRAAREPGSRSVQAPAIRGTPFKNVSIVGMLVISPAPNEMLPFEFRKKLVCGEVQTPRFAPKTNSKPPLWLSPLNGKKDGSPPATCWLGSKALKSTGPFVTSSPCELPFGRVGNAARFVRVRLR